MVHPLLPPRFPRREFMKSSISSLQTVSKMMGSSTKTSLSGVKMAMTGKYLQVEELQQLQILDKNYTLNLDEVQLTITDD